jgi:hypothetical protein
LRGVCVSAVVRSLKSVLSRGMIDVSLIARRLVVFDLKR